MLTRLTTFGFVLLAAVAACAQPSNDDCVNAIGYTCGQMILVDLSDATIAPTEPAPACARPGAMLSGAVWYRFRANSGSIRLSTCASDGGDAVMTLYGSRCNSLFPLACNEDDCGLLPEFCFSNLFVGNTYYIQIAAHAGSEGLYVLDSDCNCVSGACCFTDGSCEVISPAHCATKGGAYAGDSVSCGGANCDIGACCLHDGSCVFREPLECENEDGVFQGRGSDCFEVACPQPPDNDACIGAIGLTCGMPIQVDLAEYTLNGGPIFICGSEDDRAAWFRFTAAGDSARISTCATPGLVDTTLSLWTACTALRDCDEDAGDLNDVVCPPQRSLLCATGLLPGTEYFVRVGMHDALSTSSLVTVQLDCECPVGACCFRDGRCELRARVDCPLDPNGPYLSYQGDGSVCADCPAHDNDACADALFLNCGESAIAHMDLAQREFDDPLGACVDAGFVGSLWYRFLAEDTSAVVTLCGDQPRSAEVSAYRGVCGALQPLRCARLDCDSGTSLCLPALELGEIVYLQVTVNDDAARQDYTLTIACPCDVGACCLPDGSCVEAVTRPRCEEPNSLSGVWGGPQSQCSAATCGNYPDDCASAIFCDVIPAHFVNTTAFATSDNVPSGCGVGVISPGVWYSVLGDGGEMTVSTCHPASDIDTRISVYCGDCDALTCIASNDDSTTGGAACDLRGQRRLSMVSFCTQFGAEYYAMVHGVGGTGRFELTVTGGVSCAGSATLCEPVGACCLGGTCELTTQAGCGLLGGVFAGVGTACGERWPSADGFIGSPAPFIDISSTGTLITAISSADDAGVVIPIGFSFTFYNQPFVNIGVSSNGYMSFGTDLDDASNDTIPNSTRTPDGFIAPLWDDLSARDAFAGIYREVRGVAPDRQLIVQWNKLPQAADEGNLNAAMTFEAILYESDSSIEFRYLQLATPSSPTDWTIGIESPDGVEGVAIAQSALQVGLAWRLEQPLSEDPCEDAQPCEDIDGNGFVDLADLAAILARFGSREGDPQYDARADFNHDGFVNLADLAGLLAHFGVACP
ncbi:MAG: hypothetical protein KDA32_00375 [Phycisphaerales bacterium]|nr:hypothetical protein [Phycisphaerales bacterium]